MKNPVFKGIGTALVTPMTEKGIDYAAMERLVQRQLDANIDANLLEDVLIEMEDMGGFCDCEIALNCYEDYDL